LLNYIIFPPKISDPAAALKLFRVALHWSKLPIPHLQTASFTSPEQRNSSRLSTTIPVLLTTSFNRRPTTNSTWDIKKKKCETRQTWQTQASTCYARTSETASFNRLCLGFLESTGHEKLSGTKHARFTRCHYEHRERVPQTTATNSWDIVSHSIPNPTWHNSSFRLFSFIKHHAITNCENGGVHSPRLQMAVGDGRLSISWQNAGYELVCTSNLRINTRHASGLR